MSGGITIFLRSSSIISKKIHLKILSLLSLLILVLFSTQIFISNDSNVPNLTDDSSDKTLEEEQSQAVSNRNDYSFSRAGSDYDFTLKCEDNSHITNGGDPTGYFIEITNTGKFQDTIILNWEIINVTGGTAPDPKEWDAFLNHEQVSLNPSNSRKVILNVSTDCGCQIETKATIKVTGYSANNPSLVKSIETYTTRGPDVDYVRLEGPKMSKFADLVAGQKLNFTLKVVNPSSNPQSFKITNQAKPVDWKIEFNEDPFKVGPFSTYNFNVKTQLPIKILPKEYSFQFLVQSTYDPHVKDMLEIKFALLPELLIRKIKLSDKEPIVDEQIKVIVTIANEGPALANDVEFEVFEQFGSGSEILLNKIIIDTFSGSTEQIQNVTWTPSLEGLYNLTAHVDRKKQIQEEGNSEFNNFKIKGFKIYPNSSSENGKNGENGNSKEEKDIIEGIFSSENMIYLIICIVTVLIILFYFIFHRLKKSKNAEKTAKKIPLNRQSSSKKTAKKMKLDEPRVKGKRGGESIGKGKNRNKRYNRRRESSSRRSKNR